MKVLVGTKNKAKLLGVEKALNKYFKDIIIEGISVESNVSEQPINKEIYEGANNRVSNLIKYSLDNKIDSDYFIGIESGITNLLGSWVNITIVVIEDKNGIKSIGYSEAYPIPEKYLNDIKIEGLGNVISKIFNDNKLDSNKGGIDYLTNNKITRSDLTSNAVIMALTTFINKDKWK